MFGSLGFPEIALIVVLALLIFGPRRLPELGRTVGRSLGEFRRASDELKRSINTELALEEEGLKDDKGAARSRRPAALPSPTASPEAPAPRVVAAAEARSREALGKEPAPAEPEEPEAPRDSEDAEDTPSA